MNHLAIPSHHRSTRARSTACLRCVIRRHAGLAGHVRLASRKRSLTRTSREVRLLPYGDISQCPADVSFTPAVTYGKRIEAGCVDRIFATALLNFNPGEETLVEKSE